MLQDDLRKSIEYFSKIIHASKIDSKSHYCIKITGLDSNPETIQNLAIYIVGNISNAIEANLKISANLMKSNKKGMLELKSCMLHYIGLNNNYITEAEKHFIDRVRNPYLAEVILHLLLNVSRNVVNLHPPGKVHAVSFVHDLATDNGIDTAALYEGACLGITIAECKAYEKRPTDAVRDATGFYDDFENNFILGRRIRTQVQTMRNSLPKGTAKKAVDSFWEEEKCFLPVIFYDSLYDQDWTRKRRTMQNLTVPKDRRVLIPIDITEYRDFFNLLCDGMRSYAEELLLHV